MHEVLRGRDVRLAWSYTTSHDRHIGKPTHEEARDQGEVYARTEGCAHIIQHSHHVDERNRQKQQISVAFPDVDADTIWRRIAIGKRELVPIVDVKPDIFL